MYTPATPEYSEQTGRLKNARKNARTPQLHRAIVRINLHALCPCTHTHIHIRHLNDLARGMKIIKLCVCECALREAENARLCACVSVSVSYTIRQHTKKTHRGNSFAWRARADRLNPLAVASRCLRAALVRQADNDDELACARHETHTHTHESPCAVLARWYVPFVRVKPNTSHTTNHNHSLGSAVSPSFSCAARVVWCFHSQHASRDARKR